jgi:methionyl-tRNA formyltransferase
MKKKRIALFANHRPGIEIAKFFTNRNDREEIVALYLSGVDVNNDNEIRNALNLEASRVFLGKGIVLDQYHVDWLQQQDIDAIICVYWPWILKENVFNLVKVTVNFHPAYLPINRGWYPHVHSLIDGSKTGVTLHQIQSGADTGPIWAQREVVIQPLDTAKTIYERLQTEIISLFKEKWNDIISGNITPTQQDESIANYHAKKEIEILDHIDLEQEIKAGDLINLLRARSFGKRGFAYYLQNGKKVYINLSLADRDQFE